MYASGTPLCVLGGPPLNFQAQPQDVVVPLLGHTMQELQCSLCIPLWDFMGLGISLTPKPNEINQKGKSSWTHSFQFLSSFTSSVNTNGSLTIEKLTSCK